MHEATDGIEPWPGFAAAQPPGRRRWAWSRPVADAVLVPAGTARVRVGDEVVDL